MTTSELRKQIEQLKEDKFQIKNKIRADLKDLTKLAIEASIKHSKLVTKNTDHSHNLLKVYREEKADRKRLNNVIDIKQREIDELNKKNTDLLWDLSRLQITISELEKENNELKTIKSAHIEKRLKKFINTESVDN
jgi:FtsZ-binding cell division protein ZapB